MQHETDEKLTEFAFASVFKEIALSAFGSVIEMKMTLIPYIHIFRDFLVT